jgi:radical SAM superfamily enzyme YgiQ (UPF0313 family)
MTEIVLINPRFEPSFWGMEHALPVFDKKANIPVASLPLLAALIPPDLHVTLIDENVEPLDFDRLAKADLVGLTGMIVQRFRMREILTELKQRGAFTVVGGPWVSVQENYFGDLADVIFVGEAEETWPRFLREWQEGRHARRYEQAEKTDMTRVPTPRFDMLKMSAYLFGSLQFSRGCPFQCEFCDIIVTFGRRPRLKTSAQVIAELEALLAQDVYFTFVVDDNLIGNKKAIKALLRDVIAWQRDRGYLMGLMTEASLDLAEDPELLGLMAEANFLSVFVGVETPHEASLREAKKYQNVRAERSILDRIHTIQSAGLEVTCGMILGFDNDDSTIFDAQRAFLREARISEAMIGMLAAIPKTPLHTRLAHEGRLDSADVSVYGTNVIPLQMSRQTLRDGYVQVLKDMYEPEAYFGRMAALYEQKPPFFSAMNAYYRDYPWRHFKEMLKHIVAAAVLFIRLLRYVPEAALRRAYCRWLIRLLRERPNPRILLMFAVKCAMHYHLYTLSTQMAAGQSAVVNSF